MSVEGAARNEVCLLRDTGEFLDEVSRQLDRARRRAYVECFIVRSDRLGRRLLDTLAEAAVRGADARLLYDPGGSYQTPPGFWDEYRRRGVSIRAYGQAAFLGLLRPGVHNHARVVLADGVAFTGGHAWGDQWLPKSEGGAGWRDLNCKVVGPLVDEWATLFEQRWSASSSSRIARLDTEERYAKVRLICDGPGRRRGILEAYLNAFEQARRRIWLGNAYFFPTLRFKHALYRAAERDVDVRIIVPKNSDLPAIARAARSACAGWLQNGLSVYAYERGMFHAKYGLVDDDWCTIGSYNAVGSAATLTVETNLVVRDVALVEAVGRRFEDDLRFSQPIEQEALESRTAFTRAVDYAAWVALTAVNRVTGAADNH